MDVLGKFFLIAFSLAMSIIVIMFAMKNQKIKNYLKSFWKHYLLRKPKLILTIILTIVVYIWINNVFRDAISSDVSSYKNFYSLLFLRGYKPLFIYISGLIIIKNI